MEVQGWEWEREWEWEKGIGKRERIIVAQRKVVQQICAELRKRQRRAGDTSRDCGMRVGGSVLDPSRHD